MRVRHKVSKREYSEHGFNTHGLGEMIIGGDDIEMDSVFIKDYEVYLTQLGDWMDMRRAFEDHYLITDNYNTIFFEPQTPEDRVRGFSI